MPAVHFSAELQGSIRSRAVRLGGELGRGKCHIRAWFFRREADGCLFRNQQAVAELRIADRNLSIRTLEIELIRTCVWIHKVGKSLSDQDVFGLSIRMAQTRCGCIGAEEISLHEKSHASE